MSIVISPYSFLTVLKGSIISPFKISLLSLALIASLASSVLEEYTSFNNLRIIVSSVFTSISNSITSGFSAAKSLNSELLGSESPINTEVFPNANNDWKLPLPLSFYGPQELEGHPLMDSFFYY